MKSWKNSAVRWLHIIHRDLGYLMVGVCIIYGLSGMLLNHMNGQDPAYKSGYYTLEFPKGLDKESLTTEWAGDPSRPGLKLIMPIDNEHSRVMLDGGIGVYNSATGIMDYETHKKRALIYWVNKLHYNKVNGWSIMADFFAVSLIFFALSGLFMVRGRKGLAGRGKWFLLVGVLIPVCYVIFA